MGKLLKIILSITAFLVVLVVVAAIVLPMIIDPNDYKAEIMSAVKDKTGRTLEIDGDIGLSVFPWLGLDLGVMRLGNAEGFGEEYMASMQAVQVRVKLLPLLKKQLEVDTVKLAGLELNLAKDKAGRTNWADLQQESERKPDQHEEDTGTGGTAGLAGLAVGGIDVTGARIVWDDRSSDTRYVIDDLSLTTGKIATGQPFDFDLRFKMAATDPAVASQFELAGEVLIAPDMQAVDIKNTRLGIHAEGDGVPAGKTTVSLKSDLALDLGAQTLSLPNLIVEALGLKITGSANGSDLSGTAAKYSGVLKVDGFVPRHVIRALGQPMPATADPAVLDKADLAFDWDASPQHFAVNGLALHLDDTSVTGKARVDSFDAPAISFTLAVDSIDLDRYLPPPPAEGAAAESAPAGKDAPPQLDGLRKLNLNGKVSVTAMKAFNLEYRDAELQVKSRDGVLRMHPMGAKLYGGTYSGDITLDASKQTPRISVNENIAGVQAGPLLKDLTGKEKLLGTANMKAQFSGTGLTPEELRRSVNGTASFSFTDGAVKGVNIAALIRQARAKLKGTAAPEASGPNQTDFAELSGSATVTNGLVRNDDLLLQSPLLRIAGTGQTSLVDETIDYTLTTKLVGSIEGQGGQGLQDLKGVSIPVKVGGTWSKPSYVPDVAAALSEAAKEKVKEKVDEKLEQQKQKIEEKIGDKIGDQLGDKLKGLFK